MADFDFTLDGTASRKLIRELGRAIATGGTEFASGQMMLPSMGLTLGGIFTADVLKHELVLRALESGDAEELAWAQRRIRDLGHVARKEGYVTVQSVQSPNRVPNVGLDFVLNVLCYTTAKISTWYYGPFTTNWTPPATLQSNWAGISSGPLAVELADADFDESGRQAAVFGSAASSQSITNSSATPVTFATGTSGISIYGLSLNQSSTVAYNSTDKIVLAATKFSEALTGLAEGSILNMGYTIGVAST